MHHHCYFMHLFAGYAKLLHDLSRSSRMHKTRRQQRTLSLIRARRIGTQQELSAMLERPGFVATQSSISRDLEELGVVKQHGYYTMPRAKEGASARGLLGLAPAGDWLVVPKCEPGMASSLAVGL